MERQIKRAKEVADAVVVAVHWGAEDTHWVRDDVKELARKLVGWGADVILGSHPHTAETMEYIDRPDGTRGFVLYSMGNFMFDQQFDETVYSAAIDATAKFDPSTNFDAWDSLGRLCLQKHGDCIEDIVSSGLPRLDLTWTNYDFVATTDANTIQTRLGDEADRAFVGNRLNWNNVVSGLK